MESSVQAKAFAECALAVRPEADGPRGLGRERPSRVRTGAASSAAPQAPARWWRRSLQSRQALHIMRRCPRLTVWLSMPKRVNQAVPAGVMRNPAASALNQQPPAHQGFAHREHAELAGEVVVAHARLAQRRLARARSAHGAGAKGHAHQRLRAAAPRRGRPGGNSGAAPVLHRDSAHRPAWPGAR